MPSKMVTDREKSSRFVQAAAFEYAAEVARLLEEQLTPYLQEDESFPDMELYLKLLGRRLQGHIQALVEADQAHEAEQTDDIGVRSDRDSAAAELREGLLQVRALAEAYYGESQKVLVLGFQGRIDADPAVLLRQAKTAHEYLSRPLESFPPLKDSRLSMDPRTWNQLIVEPLARLEKDLEQVATELRELGATQEAKNNSMDANDKAFRGTAAILEATFRSVDLADRAAQIRPSERNGGQTEIPVEDLPEPEQSSQPAS